MQFVCTLVHHKIASRYNRHNEEIIIIIFPNSIWLVTSRLDMTGLDTFDVSSESRRACRACRVVLFDKLDTAKMHGLDTSNVSSRVVSRLDEPSGIWAIILAHKHSKTRSTKECEQDRQGRLTLH